MAVATMAVVVVAAAEAAGVAQQQQQQVRFNTYDKSLAVATREYVRMRSGPFFTRCTSQFISHTTHLSLQTSHHVTRHTSLYLFSRFCSASSFSALLLLLLLLRVLPMVVDKFN